MKILLVHNAYKNRGGEDSVVDAEQQLLSSHGSSVQTCFASNDAIDGMSRPQLIRATFWNPGNKALLQERAKAFRPDLIHVHNTFPLISPSIYWAADHLGIPVVQTIHNFRLHCPQAMFLRGGEVCEDCKGNLPWRGVVRKCYRNSYAQSAVLAGMVSVHRAMGTYDKKVTRYIALNHFCRDKLIEGGLPAERIVIKPNFIDAGPADLEGARSGGLFVGRLSAEKGIAVLAGAAEQCAARVSVIGGGELAGIAEKAFGERYLGFRDLPFILEAMRNAVYLVVPSICYESFPRTIVEAFASGLPVIASRLGALAEIVEEGRTGLLFEPGNAADLAQKLAWAEANPDEMARMGRNARAEYEAKYTAATNYQQLMAIYAEAIEAKAKEIRK
ncbi:glycosyltransferase [Uliginosibacterium paludis]|uniref:Glycosyltransferase n=1 Tax=Uliginosibacterium paludis TaxID=1615952 RepID=A0ABV2CUV3_9RHOO